MLCYTWARCSGFHFPLLLSEARLVKCARVYAVFCLVFLAYTRPGWIPVEHLRLWCSGSTTAFQAVDTGSIPANRFHGALSIIGNAAVSKTVHPHGCVGSSPTCAVRNFIQRRQIHRYIKRMGLAPKTISHGCGFCRTMKHPSTGWTTTRLYKDFSRVGSSRNGGTQGRGREYVNAVCACGVLIAIGWLRGTELPERTHFSLLQGGSASFRS